MRLNPTAAALLLAVAIGSMGISVAAQEAKPNVIYKPAPVATLKYNDGVTVHRHSDGSVEVSDPESAPEPLYGGQSSGGTRSRKAVRKVSKAKAVAKTV